VELLERITGRAARTARSVPGATRRLARERALYCPGHLWNKDDPANHKELWIGPTTSTNCHLVRPKVLMNLDGIAVGIFIRDILTHGTVWFAARSRVWMILLLKGSAVTEQICREVFVEEGA
jgi:hypothetical protein